MESFAGSPKYIVWDKTKLLSKGKWKKYHIRKCVDWKTEQGGEVTDRHEIRRWQRSDKSNFSIIL